MKCYSRRHETFNAENRALSRGRSFEISRRAKRHAWKLSEYFQSKNCGSIRTIVNCDFKLSVWSKFCQFNQLTFTVARKPTNVGYANHISLHKYQTYVIGLHIFNIKQVVPGTPLTSANLLLRYSTPPPPDQCM